MKLQVVVNKAAQTVTVEAGANAGQVLAAILPLGLYTPVAGIDAVGMGGFLLGGGYGDNGNQYGLGCDSVVNFEVVDTRGGANGSAATIQVQGSNHNQELVIFIFLLLILSLNFASKFNCAYHSFAVASIS